MKLKNMNKLSKKPQGNEAKTLLCAENIVRGVKYELTYIPIEWNCPFCKTENSTTLILEEDLNHSQDNFDTCRKCKKKITLKASAIFCT